MPGSLLGFGQEPLDKSLVKLSRAKTLIRRVSHVSLLLRDVGVEDELPSQFSGPIEHEPRVAGFVSVLQESTSARNKLISESKQLWSAIEESRIKDGVKAGK
jgi:hypothetical protein